MNIEDNNIALAAAGGAELESDIVEEGINTDETPTHDNEAPVTITQPTVNPPATTHNSVVAPTQSNQPASTPGSQPASGHGGARQRMRPSAPPAATTTTVSAAHQPVPATYQHTAAQAAAHVAPHAATPVSLAYPQAQGYPFMPMAGMPGMPVHQYGMPQVSPPWPWPVGASAPQSAWPSMDSITKAMEATISPLVQRISALEHNTSPQATVSSSPTLPITTPAPATDATLSSPATTAPTHTTATTTSKGKAPENLTQQDMEQFLKSELRKVGLHSDFSSEDFSILL